MWIEEGCEYSLQGLGLSGFPGRVLQALVEFLALRFPFHSQALQPSLIHANEVILFGAVFSVLIF